MQFAPRLKNRFRTPLDFSERREPRLMCSFDAEMVNGDGEVRPVRIFNFSRAGFMMASRVPVNSGARITLRLQDYGEARVRILWSQEMQTGGVFEDMIDADALLAHLEQRDQIAPQSG